MTYVDGFIVIVPTKNIESYRKIAEVAGKIWMEYGALQFKECVAEDIEDKGYCSTFPQTIKPKEDETVLFSFIVFNSRQHRDEVNAKVMEDPRLKDSCDPENMPFDCKRMTYGGFNTIVEF
jgi:uncharacterized protein YbaA (DUF1428 family)